MHRRIVIIVGAALLQWAAETSLHAQSTITKWSFTGNPTPTTSPPASQGVGVASVLGGVTASYAAGSTSASTDRAWSLSSFPTTTAKSGTAGAMFQVATVGFTDLVVRWKERHSNTSPNTELFQISQDGVNFTTYQSITRTLGDTWFNNSVDLSGLAGAANNPNFAFRMVAATDPATGAFKATNPGSTVSGSGTWRLDDVEVLGGTFAPVPEPEEYAAVGAAALGVFAVIRHRRRRRPAQA